MIMRFGQHQTKTVESLVVRKPDYISWVLDRAATTAGFHEVQVHARRLIAIFDAKPYAIRCGGCGQAASRCVVYVGSPRPYFFCSACRPTSLGADEGKLRELTSYREAISWIATTCNGRKDDLRHLIHEMASAKGLRKRVTHATALAFFRDR